MLFKVLFLLNLMFIVISIKTTLFNKKTMKEQVKEMYDRYGESVCVISYFISGIAMGIMIIPFYIMSYSLSNMIGWLSAIQIVLTMKGIFIIWSLVSKYNRDEIKEYSLLYKLLNLLLDIVYIISVGYTVFII